MKITYRRSGFEIYRIRKAAQVMLAKGIAELDARSCNSVGGLADVFEATGGAPD